MSPDLAKMSFYFPKVSRPIKTKRELFDLIIRKMRSDGNIKRTGFLKEKIFLKELLNHIGNNTFFKYKNLSAAQKKIIQKNIIAVLEKSNKILPHPDLPIFIFAYPWFPHERTGALFQGVNAFAAYYTIHLFIDLKNYKKNSIRQTLAHEWSHLVFYRYHLESQYTLCTYMIMEGLAEVFREEIIGGGISPWASALNNQEAEKQLKSFSKKLLARKGMKIYHRVFLGNKKYKRWTGYSIGYWLVKKFRTMNPDLSWKEIVKTKPENILKSIKK
jgi:uncharacterized protein YjaZ